MVREKTTYLCEVEGCNAEFDTLHEATEHEGIPFVKANFRGVVLRHRTKLGEFYSVFNCTRDVNPDHSYNHLGRKFMLTGTEGAFWYAPVSISGREIRTKINNGEFLQIGMDVLGMLMDAFEIDEALTSEYKQEGGLRIR